MRITNQMLYKSSMEAGIQINTTLLDELNQSDSSSNIFSGLNLKSTSVSPQKDKYTKIEESAGQLSEYASLLSDKSKDSLFAKAETSGSNVDIVKNVKNLVEAYNTTITNLKTTNSTLDQYYLMQLKALVADNVDALKTVGITQSSDGTIHVDTKTLDSASVSNLKAAFGSSNIFSSKLSYVSEKVEQNAKANIASASSQYTSNGISANLNNSSKYSYLG